MKSVGECSKITAWEVYISKILKFHGAVNRYYFHSAIFLYYSHCLLRCSCADCTLLKLSLKLISFPSMWNTWKRNSLRDPRPMNLSGCAVPHGGRGNCAPEPCDAVT